MGNPTKNEIYFNALYFAKVSGKSGKKLLSKIQIGMQM